MPHQHGGGALPPMTETVWRDFYGGQQSSATVLHRRLSSVSAPLLMTGSSPKYNLQHSTPFTRSASSYYLRERPHTYQLQDHASTLKDKNFLIECYIKIPDVVSYDTNFSISTLYQQRFVCCANYYVLLLTSVIWSCASGGENGEYNITGTGGIEDLSPGARNRIDQRYNMNARSSTCYQNLWQVWATSVIWLKEISWAEDVAFYLAFRHAACRVQICIKINLGLLKTLIYTVSQKRTHL